MSYRHILICKDCNKKLGFSHLRNDYVMCGDCHVKLQRKNTGVRRPASRDVGLPSESTDTESGSSWSDGLVSRHARDNVRVECIETVADEVAGNEA